MTPEVETAISEIRQTFSGHKVDVIPEDQGGAYIIVDDLFIGDQYTPSQSWVGFLINFQYPRSDVYPHFIDGNIRRLDGAALGEGISGPIDWQNRKALQISRASRRLDVNHDTADIKLEKVLQWLRFKQK